LRIVRKIAVLALIAAPIGVVMGTGAGAVSRAITTTPAIASAGAPALVSPEAYGAEALGSTFTTDVTGDVAATSDFPEGDVVLAVTGTEFSGAALPAGTELCDSNFAGAGTGANPTTVGTASESIYSCTGPASTTALPASNGAGYVVTAKFIPGAPSSALNGFNDNAASVVVDASLVITQTTIVGTSTPTPAAPYKAGQSITDTAFLTGAVNPTGTVDFAVQVVPPGATPPPVPATCTIPITITPATPGFVGVTNVTSTTVVSPSFNVPGPAGE